LVGLLWFLLAFFLREIHCDNNVKPIIFSIFLGKYFETFGPSFGNEIQKLGT